LGRAIPKGYASRCGLAIRVNNQQPRKMTRFIHDQFAKKYLAELLAFFGEGEVKTSVDIAAEVKQADVLFIAKGKNPANNPTMTMAAKLAASSALLEPFRNAVSPKELVSCCCKLNSFRDKIEREAKRKKKKISEAELPFLWIISPTFSSELIKRCCAVPDKENYPKGVYLLPDILQGRVIAVHQLPDNPETLWFRILGRGKVQEKAIKELKSLPLESTLRNNALELVYEMLSLLEVRQKQQLDQEDKELVMQLSTIYLEKLENATQQGIEQGIERGIEQGIEQGIERGIEQGIERGIEQGIEQGIERGIEQGIERGIERGLEQGIERGKKGERRVMIESLLRIRFGSIDEEISRIIEPLTALSPEEFTPLLLQSSREDLLARF